MKEIKVLMRAFKQCKLDTRRERDFKTDKRKRPSVLIS